MAELSSVDLGEGVRCLVVDHDPTTTPTAAGRGSLIVTTTGRHYRKLDDGSSTNVADISDGGGLPVVTVSFTEQQTVKVQHNRGYRPIVQVDFDVSGRFGRGRFGREGFGQSGEHRVIANSLFTLIHIDDDSFVLEFSTPRTGHVHYN